MGANPIWIFMRKKPLYKTTITLWTVYDTRFRKPMDVMDYAVRKEFGSYLAKIDCVEIREPFKDQDWKDEANQYFH